jgi:hypothetical protein
MVLKFVSGPSNFLGIISVYRCLMVTMFTGGYSCYFALAHTLFGLISRFTELSSITM